jgi:hypothetical protein
MEEKKLINPFISFDQYDKISDDVYFLGQNAILKFNVSLSKTSDAFGRQHFHKEFEYSSKNYDKPLVTIRRSFDYFLTIENIKHTDDGKKEYIRIGIEEMILFKQRLKEAAKWFSDPKYKDLYVTHKDQLVMRYKLERIELPYLPMGKYLSFQAIIYTFGEEQAPGVRMYLSDENNFVDMHINKFMGLVYLIDNMNLYESAQLMLNYINRPENGYNLMSFDNSERVAKQSGEETVTGKPGRKIQTKQTDFFRQMEGMVK